MSLQVWLPLNGNLHNQGLSDITVTNNSATVDNNGKIGKCYYFNGSGQYLQLSKSLTNLYAGDFSWAIWLKPADATRGIIFSEYSSTGASNVAFELLANRVIRVYWAASPDWSTGISIEQNVWSHVAITRHENILKVYVNGELKATKSDATLANKTSSSFIRLGDDYRGGTSVSYMGYMNDARIYDHALSTKEVEEIAKGLVLHYKLDTNLNVLDNCYNYPTFNTTSSNGGWNHWGPSGHAGTYSQNTDKQYIYNKANTYSHCVDNTASATGKYYLCYQSPAFDGGYRSLQFIVKEANGLPITETICCPGWNARNGGAPSNKWTRIINLGDSFYLCQVDGLSQDGSNDLVSISVQPGYKIYISEGYLENNREICSNIFNQNNLNTIYDSSGYGNNGTIIGSLETVVPSPRYGCATKFDGNTSCIKIPYNEINPDRIFTVNLWFHKDALGSKNYETLFGGPSGFEMDTRAGASTTLSLYMTSVHGGNVFSPFNLNKWYMVTIVRDGTNEMYYINGELKKTIEAKSMPSGQYRIGAWASDTGQNYYGDMSDFRIYATALTPEQIKELYNTSMSIDNNGNIHARELVEL